MTSSDILEARRARVVNRARGRAITKPSVDQFALIGWLQTAPAEMFETDLVDIQVHTEDSDNPEFTVDGQHYFSQGSAVAALQDRYGIGADEAKGLLAVASQAHRAPRRPSPVTPIGWGGR